MKRPLLHVLLTLSVIHPVSFASGSSADSKTPQVSSKIHKSVDGKRTPQNCSQLCMEASLSRQKIKDLIERHGVRPNILDKKTYDQQTEIVFLTTKEIHSFVQNNRSLIEDPQKSEEALSELVSIWLLAIEFDPHHAIAIQNAEVLDPHFDRLQNHLNAQLKKREKSRPRQGLVNLRLALAIAESELSGEGNAKK